jgi:hypothetical protein
MVIGRRMLAVVVLFSFWASGRLSERAAEAAVVLGGSTDADEFYTITFDHVGLMNPSVTFADVPNVGDLTVSFGTHFVGQSRGSTYNSLADTSPLGPLALDPSGNTKVMFDLSAPSGIMLGGVDGLALYTTPLAILFSDEVNFVSFDLGNLDDTVALIEAFDDQGNSLGVFNNLSLGHNRYTLSDTNGENVIAGVSIYVPNGKVDLEGFGINNLQIVADGVIPEPATFVVWSLLIGCAATAGWWQRRTSTTVATIAVERNSA